MALECCRSRIFAVHLYLLSRYLKISGAGTPKLFNHPTSEYMAKKNKNKEEEPKEVVANCDQPTVCSQLDIANCDIKNINIESLIRVIRGQKVMLDSDLAMLYGVTTSRLNEQVKRNINRFPDDFMFQLTKEEWNDLKSQNAISKVPDNVTVTNLMSQIAISSWGGSRKPPYVFTRNGIGMLSSVLRSGTAVEVNIRIMRAFTAIPEIVNWYASVGIRYIFN